MRLGGTKDGTPVKRYQARPPQAGRARGPDTVLEACHAKPQRVLRWDVRITSVAATAAMLGWGRSGKSRGTKEKSGN